MVSLEDALDMRSGGSLSFRFRTLEPRGLLAIAIGNSPTFFSIEIFDGILYFVYDLGTLTSRKQFTDSRVDDGEWHEVCIDNFNNIVNYNHGFVLLFLVTPHNGPAA